MPLIAIRQFNSLLLINFFIALLSHSDASGIPPRRHSKDLDHFNRHELPSSPNQHHLCHDFGFDGIITQQQEPLNQLQSQLNGNEIIQNTERLHYWKSYQQQQPILYKMKAINVAMEQNYQRTKSALNVPLAANRQASEIDNARNTQETPVLSHYYHHPDQSNQRHYAPKRRLDVNPRSTNDKLLPYPPSFISITSTSTTIGPPHDAGYKNSVQSVGELSDIFVTRQHKSLLDSYIPSWVMANMLQQHKWLQQKQLYKFVATHTLAYPITQKSA